MQISTKLMIEVAVFATAASFVLTAMLPILYPYAADASDDYSDLAAERAGLVQYAGTSMLTQAPYTLVVVYTPYVPGQTVNEDSFTADGWLYGESISDYPYIGKYKEIRLDPDQKSDSVLTTNEDSVSYMRTFTQRYMEGDDNLIQNAVNTIQRWIMHDLLGESATYKKQVSETDNYWVYSGYRYVFQPKVAVDAGASATDRITLSIVWYQILSTEGISAGLNIYNEKTRTLLATYTMDEIVANYNTTSNLASIYTLNFDGIPVNMSIRFDTMVLDGSTPLTTAFKNGNWTCAFSSASVAGLVDTDTGSYDMNVGSLMSTYTQVLTLSYPSIGSPWDIILFLLCSLPLAFLLLEVGMQILELVWPRWL